MGGDDRYQDGVNMNFNNYPFYLITSSPYDEISFLKLLKLALDKGIRLVQIRAKELNDDEYKKLSLSAIKLCHQYDAKALLSTKLGSIEELKADGVHLPSAEMMKITNRSISSNYILSVACHDEEQVIHASKINADLVVISPVFLTPSSPNGKPLGWSKFLLLAKLSKVPVYALGGVTPKDLAIARSHGATGVAAIRAFWNE